MRFARSWALRSRLGAGGARRTSRIAQQRFKNQKPFSKENQRAPGLTPPSPIGNSSRTTFRAATGLNRAWWGGGPPWSLKVVRPRSKQANRHVKSQKQNPKAPDLRKLRTGHGGTGGPPGPYLVRDPGRPDAILHRQLRFRNRNDLPEISPRQIPGDSKGTLFESKTRSQMQFSVPGYRGRTKIWTQGAPPSRHALKWPPLPFPTPRSARAALRAFGPCARGSALGARAAGPHLRPPKPRKRQTSHSKSSRTRNLH